ncbi:TPA: hypothetical protein HA318_04900 [Candidatus Micrarchaeota archaeon]|nr:hypothetical protein [Candidatus Micrarchaeota archaeon]
MLRLKERSEVVLDEGEHCSFQWVLPRDALQLQLIEDEDACLKALYCL